MKCPACEGEGGTEFALVASVADLGSQRAEVIDTTISLCLLCEGRGSLTDGRVDDVLRFAESCLLAHAAMAAPTRTTH